MPGDPNSTYEQVALHLLGRPRYTLAQLAAELGRSEDDIQTYWRSLGFPDAPSGQVCFTDDDLAAIDAMGDLVDAGDLSIRAVQTLVRAQGHSMDRLVLWQVEALVEEIATRHQLDDVSARLVVLDKFSDLSPVLERQLTYTWRRQLAALLERFDREFARSATISQDADELPLERAVGFMDMVGYTSRTVALPPHELATIVRELESTARDVVAANGARVVKTIGDAVLYVADDLPSGARVATELIAVMARHHLPVRCSVVWGRVLSRSGDIFGPTVNLASRLNDLAATGTALMDDVSAAILEASDPSFELTPLAPAQVHGLGEVHPVRLSRRNGAAT